MMAIRVGSRKDMLSKPTVLLKTSIARMLSTRYLFNFFVGGMIPEMNFVPENLGR